MPNELSETLKTTPPSENLIGSRKDSLVDLWITRLSELRPYEESARPWYLAYRAVSSFHRSAETVWSLSVWEVRDEAPLHVAFVKGMNLNFFSIRAKRPEIYIYVNEDIQRLEESLIDFFYFLRVRVLDRRNSGENFPAFAFPPIPSNAPVDPTQPGAPVVVDPVDPDLVKDLHTLSCLSTDHDMIQVLTR